jgi:hypothetical protein
MHTGFRPGLGGGPKSFQTANTIMLARRRGCGHLNRPSVALREKEVLSDGDWT